MDGNGMEKYSKSKFFEIREMAKFPKQKVWQLQKKLISSVKESSQIILRVLKLNSSRIDIGS
jgi:hypothetical protein